MAEIASSPPPPVAPVIKRVRRFSPVWLIPIIAALLSLWLVWKYYSARGPEVTVRFETAEGIAAGKTPVMCRNVNIGVVERLRLTSDLKGVIVTLQMTSEATDLLRKDTQIWVVRPRFGGGGISGLTTVVSGSYIEIAPGLSHESRRDFVGIEQPPVTPKGVPGLHVTLHAEEAGGIGPGTAILYKGLSAGQIETRVFHPEVGQVEFTAFIKAEFAKLVHARTKFWNVSGIDVEVGANGLHVRTGTLESILTSGITFGEPDNEPPSPTVADGASFTLFNSLDDTKKFVMKTSLPYLLLFNESVRGLNPEAPVEFRGIRIGTVEGISFRYLPDDPERRVPVFIKIDVGLITDLPPDDNVAAENFLVQNVAKGLRASLKTGSLLTGQLFVDLDFQKNAEPAMLADIANYKVLPTAPSGGLSQLQEKAAAFMDKLQALELEKTVANATAALAAIKSTAQNADKTVSGFNDKSPLYQELSQAIRQLDETLRSVRTLSGTIEQKPNSLIFGKPGKVAPPKGTPP
ncbi:MAG: MlaD family protein [Verrucomicrobiota bacterium]|nr:MlaD family protein [Verrucomicrobiota bacterium]